MESYTYERMRCFKCKRIYSLTIQADSYASAVKQFRAIERGEYIVTGYYFTLPIKQWIPAIACSNCDRPEESGRPGPVKIDWNFQRNEFKQPFITIKQGNKWKAPDRPESRSVEHKTLIALRNRTFEFIPDPDPLNHVSSCQCSPCRERKASKNWEPKPLKRTNDAELGIGVRVKKHREPSLDEIDEMFDNFRFFWRDLANAVN